MGKLTELKVKNAKPGVHGDGGGLYLRVKPTGARAWVLRVQHQGKREDIGLGGFPLVTLAKARDKALELRRLARDGENARAARDQKKRRVPTFAEAMVDAHAELSKGWTEKNAAHFKSSLDTYAVPRIGTQRVDRVGAEQVITVLAPIWTEKPEVARKVRVRVLQVLAFAKSKGWRSDAPPSPTELRGGLAKQPRSGNFAAMPFDAVPRFVQSQFAREATSGRLALLFTILAAARSGEVRNATWAQIDEAARTWTRPADMMKSGVQHVVTLNDAALAVLAEAKALSSGDGLIFPSSRADRPLSDMTLTKVLRDAGESATVHGFRSAFRDWAAEKQASVPAMVAEMALAHAVGTKTEKAYLRSDLRDMRRALMDAWSAFVTAPSSGE